MMKCLYLLSVVFHVAAGCDLSNNSEHHYNGYQGGSVLLPCSCSDLNTKPQTFTWESYRTGRLTDVFKDEHYRDRLHLFNKTSPGNLSLFISDLRVEDDTDYRCSTEKRYRDMTLHVKVGRRKTLTHSRKTDRRPSSEQTPSTTTHSPPSSSSTTLKQDKQQTPSRLPLVFGIAAAFLLVIVGVVVFICWRCKGGQCGEKGTTKGCLDYKIKQEDKIVSDATLFTSVIYTCYSADRH